MMADDQPTGIDWHYELALHHVERWYTALGRLQTKISIVLGFSFAMFGFILQTMENYYWAVQLPVYVSLSIGWALLFLTYLARDWNSGPSIERLMWGLRNRESWTEFRADSLPEMDKELNVARARLKEMGHYFNWAVVFLLLAAIAASVSVMLANPDSASLSCSVHAAASGLHQC